MAMYPCLSLPSLSFPSVSGAVCSFDSQYAGLPLKAHTVDIDSVSGVSAFGISATGKNLLRINKDRVATDNGVIFTTNDDMSETISGEFLGVAICRVSILVPLKTGTYILSGCPSGGGYSDYVLRVENSSNVLIALDTGNGATFTIANDQLVYCRIYIYSQNGVGKTFYPMVRMVNTNSDYEPFGTYTTINIGQTVNEATYNARTGVMEVTQPSVQTLQLPPCPIDTLEGVNNIWADTGDTTLQYIKLG